MKCCDHAAGFHTVAWLSSYYSGLITAMDISQLCNLAMCNMA